jgi:2-keto-4-pentenoate hydratase
MGDDERVHRGTAAHLERWRERLKSGAERVGWKIGLNPPAAQERAGISEPVVGHMTDATLVFAGGTYMGVEDATRLLVEPEIYVELGDDGAIAAIGAALEIVDMDMDVTDIEAVLAGNIFHRGVVFGEPDETGAGGDLAGLGARVVHSGKVVAEPDPADVVGDPQVLVDLVARTLAEHGESLERGDRIILGTLIPALPVAAGDELALDLGESGAVSVRFA